MTLFVDDTVCGWHGLWLIGCLCVRVSGSVCVCVCVCHTSCVRDGMFSILLAYIGIVRCCAILPHIVSHLVLCLVLHQSCNSWKALSSPDFGFLLPPSPDICMTPSRAVSAATTTTTWWVACRNLVKLIHSGAFSKLWKAKLSSAMKVFAQKPSENHPFRCILEPWVLKLFSTMV